MNQAFVLCLFLTHLNIFSRPHSSVPSPSSQSALWLSGRAGTFNLIVPSCLPRSCLQMYNCHLVSQNMQRPWQLFKHNQQREQQQARNIPSYEMSPCFKTIPGQVLH